MARGMRVKIPPNNPNKPIKAKDARGLELINNSISFAWNNWDDEQAFSRK